MTRSSPEQAGAIPFRRDGKRVEYCLVTRTSASGWTFPKGSIDSGNDSRETAIEESWEEAGVRGRLVGKPLGCYSYKKWGVTKLKVEVHLMEVTKVAEVWDEMSQRDRRWVGRAEAKALLREHGGLSILERAIERLES